MFEKQLRNIGIDAILIALGFFRELQDLEVGPTDHVTDFEELRQLTLVNVVDAEFVPYSR